MNEKSLFKSLSIKLLIVCVFTILYAAGGTEGMGGLWVRRILGPAIFTAGLFWFSRDWKALIAFPLLFGALTLPYGADDTAMKILLRFCFGAACGVASSTLDWLNKRWLLAALQIGIVCVVSVILGVWNDMPSAVIEQACIGCSIAFLPMMSARQKDG